MSGVVHDLVSYSRRCTSATNPLALLESVATANLVRVALATTPDQHDSLVRTRVKREVTVVEDESNVGVGPPISLCVKSHRGRVTVRDKGRETTLNCGGCDRVEVMASVKTGKTHAS